MEQQHYHNTYEIHFTVSDNLQFIIEDDFYSAPKGSLFIIHPFVPHMNIIPDDAWYERYILQIHPHVINKINVFPDHDLLTLFEFEKEANFHYFKLSDHEILAYEKLVNRYIGSSRKHGAEESIFKKIALMEVLHYLLHKKKNTHLIEAPNIQSEQYNLVKEISLYIKKHLHMNLSMKKISEEFFVSESTIGRYFKKYFGTTISQYIISQRIYFAQKLLKKNIPVFIVCEQSGFVNYHHFIRTFKKYVGVTPKQYALQYRHNI